MLFTAALTALLLSRSRRRAEEALRHAEEKYRGIFENAAEGIFQSTPEGRFLSVNTAMARMFGFASPEQMIAESTDIKRQIYVTPSRRAEMKQLLDEHGVVPRFVAQVRRRDGSHFWTSSNVRAVRDAEGAVSFYEGFVEDITERVRADERELLQKRLIALRADVSAAFAVGGIPLRDRLGQSAEAMVKHLDAAFARIWLLNPAEEVLELQASAGMYTNLNGTYSRIPIGYRMVGFIAAKRAPYLTNDTQRGALDIDSEWARREGLVAFAGYPLIVEDRMIGVMGMFARHPLQEDALDALSFIADIIAQGVERVRSAAALRESEQKFRGLIQELHIGVLLLGPKMEILLSNVAARTMLGMTESELLRRTARDPDWDVIDEDGLPFPHDEFPVPRAIATRSTVRNVVMGIYRAATRDRVWILVDAEPHRADDGSVRQVICTFSDITERRRAEEALRQSEERNRAILTAIPDLMFVQSREGVYLDYHAKDASDLYVPPEIFLGQNMRDLLPPELSEKFTSCFEHAYDPGGIQVCEYKIDLADGERMFEARIVSCNGDKILSVVRDVTAHRMAEEQRNQLLGRLVNAQEEERARLAREVHDEFAAYISALKWGIESLKRSDGLLASAESSLSYLLGLTTQLQSKVRDFAFELSPAEFDNKHGLPAALDRYVGRWSGRTGGQLEAEFRCCGFEAAHPRLPRELEMALYRVTQETLTNVLKHAEARHVLVTLCLLDTEDGGGAVRLTVEDDGVGFGTTHSEGAEHGLGLKGMGERIALVGGTLEVMSGKDGTTLVVSVPVSFPRGESRYATVADTHR
jgi:PAS domain S-box-containing protein